MKAGRNKTLLTAEEQWRRTIEYLYFLHRNRWCTWENFVRSHDWRVRWLKAEPVPEAELKQSWLKERAAGPVTYDVSGLWIARGTHRSFVAGDILPVTGRNGMAERYGMSGVTSKGIRLDNYYLPLNSQDKINFDASFFPGDLIGKRWNDPAIGRFVVDLRASSRSRVGAGSPAPIFSPVSNQKTQGIRFDGFYYSALGLCVNGSYRYGRLKRHHRTSLRRSYLRFLPDGVVVSLGFHLPLDQVRMGHFTGNYAQFGKAAWDRDSFSFLTTNHLGTEIEYAGTIDGDRLLVRLLTRKFSGRYVYKFRPFPPVQ